MRPTFIASTRTICILTLVILAGSVAASPSMPILPPGPVYNFTATDFMLDNMRLKALQDQARAKKNLRQSGSPPVQRTQVQQVPTQSARALLNTGDSFATMQGINKLAAAAPPAQRAQTAAVFKQLIITFDKTIPRTYGIPKNNLASALAAMLAGSYVAYTNRTFPDAAVKPLYRQLAQVIPNVPSLAKASMNDKAALYQVWVGMGMFMLMQQAELSKHPNPVYLAQLQQNGAHALRAMFGDPDRVRFTAKGIEFH